MPNPDGSLTPEERGRRQRAQLLQQIKDDNVSVNEQGRQFVAQEQKRRTQSQASADEDRRRQAEERKKQTLGDAVASGALTPDQAIAAEGASPYGPGLAAPGAAGTPTTAVFGGYIPGVDQAFLQQSVVTSNGTGTDHFERDDSGRMRHVRQPDATSVSVGQLMQMLGSYQPWELQQIQRQLFAAGFYRGTKASSIQWGQPDDYTLGAYESLLRQTYILNQGGTRVPWQEVLRRSAQQADANSDGSPDGADAPFSGKKTVTSTSVNLTDPVSAQGIAQNALSQYLGRQATPDDISAFRAALGAAEKASPQVTTTTGTYKDGEVTSQSSTTTGGLDAAGQGEIARQFAQSRPDYAETTVATGLMSNFLNALKSPV